MFSYEGGKAIDSEPGVANKPGHLNDISQAVETCDHDSLFSIGFLLASGFRIFLQCGIFIFSVLLNDCVTLGSCIVLNERY